LLSVTIPISTMYKNIISILLLSDIM
jgi:hypothetical protein